jgi:hypothetical protein
MRSLLVAMCFSFGSLASAQYTATILHPTGNFGSDGRGAAGGIQVGNVSSAPGVQHAAVWTGSAGSYFDLHPFADGISSAWGSSGGQHIGYGYATATGNATHALLWTGVGTNYVDLDPGGVDASTGLGIFGSMQVGYTAQSNVSHAALWMGSAGSYVDLNPVGSSGSIATSTDGISQGGSVWFPSGTHAALWTGTAASFVDLHPAGYDNSQINAIDGNLQVGHANGASTGFQSRAFKWSGTQASAIDITPASYDVAVAMGVSNGQIVGFGQQLGLFHALAWTGTNTVLDLTSFLPAGYGDTFAYGIDPSTGDIIGQAHNLSTDQYEAVMWHPVPEPASLAALSLGLAAVLRKRRLRR